VWRGVVSAHDFIPVLEFFMYQGLRLLIAATIQKIMAILVAVAGREIPLFIPEPTFFDFQSSFEI